MLLPLALAALLAAAPADTLRPGSIRGSVQGDPAGVPLPLAVVQVELGTGRVLDTTTDSTGAYRLGGIPAGRRLLRVTHLDHAPLELEVLVPAGGELVLDFGLKPRPIALDTVRATLPAPGSAAENTAAAEGDAALVTRHVLDSGPGVAPVGAGPAGGGGGDPSDPRDVLYVRGSAADLKLVLLDGAPVYAPFHMGGLIHTFDPEALAGARLYLGGAPARYDGGLSYVLEMRTRAGRPERHQTTGALDMVSARALFEGPVAGGATYLLSARGIHGGVLSRLEGDPFPYAYREGLARVDVPLGGRHALGFTGFANREGVRVDSAGGGDPAHWANAAAVVRWRGPVGATDAEATVAFTTFAASLPWEDERRLVMGAEIRRARLALDLARDAWGGRLRYGASYDGTWMRHDARLLGVQGEPLHLGTGTAGDAGGVYVDGSWQAGPRLGIRAGLRGDLFSVGTTLSLSPRASATWLVSDRAALTLAAGRYHQYLRSETRGGASFSRNFADSLGLGTELSVSRATHVALALDQQVGAETRLGLEGYFKHFEGVVGYDLGRAYNSGVDVWLRGGHGPLSGWLGYSLAWTWEEDGDDLSGSRQFSGRHLLSAGLAGELRGGARFGLRLAYGAGLPYTAVYGGTGPDALTRGGSRAAAGGLDLTGAEAGDAPPLAATPADPYVRVDAELSRTWTTRWAGAGAEFTPYLRVLNALDRRDGLFYRNSRGEKPQSVATLPILPIAGFAFRF